jgi:hypothetical protein
VPRRSTLALGVILYVRYLIWDFDNSLAYRQGMWGPCIADVVNEHEPYANSKREHQWSSDRANSRSGSSRSYVKFVNPPKVEISVSKLIELDVILQRAGPPIGHPSRRLRAIPRDNLLGQIDEGAQARSHVAASWIIEAISGIRGRPLV